MIRKAEPQDIPVICRLLEQVLKVHHTGRPDLFRATGKKYDEIALQDMLKCPENPIFVYVEDGAVLGYIMCQEHLQSGAALVPIKTLYIDDLCVDEAARGKGIGKKLFHYAKDYAAQNGFYNVTLHVWEANPAARKFYDSLGLKPQYTSLEFIV
jgi:ribosomal protein S18 acetylase RimI-like enzyme